MCSSDFSFIILISSFSPHEHSNTKFSSIIEFESPTDFLDKVFPPLSLLAHNFRLFSHKYKLYLLLKNIFVVQSLSHVWLFVMLRTAAHQASLCFPVSGTQVQWVGDAIQPSHPLLPSFFSCPQSFPAEGSFLISQFFTSGGQSVGASVSTSVLLMNIQCWFPFYYNNNHPQTSVPSVNTLLLLHLNKLSTLGDYDVQICQRDFWICLLCAKPTLLCSSSA